MSKSELRASSLRSRRSLKNAEIARLSAAVAERFIALEEFRNAQVVASYVAKEDEVQTSGIITATLAAGKTLIAPRADPATGLLTFHAMKSVSELAPGHFGVLEPNPLTPVVSLARADIAVVPTVAWDERGHRLGYGKGFFDRALSASPRPLRAGLALEVQRVSGLPQSSHDVPMDVIVTESRVLRFVGGRR